MTTDITPCLWFDGMAEQAARFHCSLFPNSRVTLPATPTPEGEKPPLVVLWEIDGQKLMGINGGPHYRLSPAFSLAILVDTQAEVDRLWNALTADGGKESMCGWCEDRFGVSWQIVPRRLNQLMDDPDREAAQRVTQAMLKMKKLVIADLEAAHAGNKA